MRKHERLEKPIVDLLLVLENGVEVTLMPVSFSKSGITGSGNSSSQLMMLSSPEDESALETIAGEGDGAQSERRRRFQERTAIDARQRQTVGRLVHVGCPPNAPGAKAEAPTDDAQRHRKIATVDASAAANPAKLG